MQAGAGYWGLRERGAWLDLADCAIIRVEGQDRIDFLHRLTTINVLALRPGQGAYGFLLSPQGRILVDFVLLNLPEQCWLDTQRHFCSRLLGLMEQYLFMEDVRVAEAGDSLVAAAVEGPESGQLLQALGLPAPDEPWAIQTSGPFVIMRASWTGQLGWRIYGTAGAVQHLRASAQATGIPVASAAEAERVRLENAKPHYGVDFDDRRLPHETQLLCGISFGKGCYPGQEIVERVQARGQVQWLLVPVELDAVEPPPAGSPLESNGAQVGEITSATYSPALGRVVGLAYIRSSHAVPGREFRVGRMSCRVRASAPYQGP